jgi:hypothetical protein
MIRLEEVDSSFDRSIDISRLYYDGGTADQWCLRLHLVGVEMDVSPVTGHQHLAGVISWRAGANRVRQQGAVNRQSSKIVIR